jgi:murein DD-endopeptidase MepM/ murein hydrolase activator NlpD
MTSFTRTLGSSLIACVFLLLSAATSYARDEGGTGPPWVWPLDPTPAVVAVFSPPDHVYGPGHRGIDLAGTPGQTVLAVAAGEVTYAGQVAGRGVVVVDHGRLHSTYQPVDADVGVGDLVEAGEPLGRLTSAHSHCAPSACLHLGAKRGQAYVDPLSLLGGRSVRLKPLDPSSQARAGSPADPLASATPPSPAGATGGAAGSPVRRWLGVSTLIAGALLLRTPRASAHARG